MFKSVPDRFISASPRYSARGLALKGPAQALFKTLCVLSCNSNYLAYTTIKKIYSLFSSDKF
ncbi:hypothetical protein C9426_29530 [Serratia sp. S1B]|nr:hypothetical protein C9426_29530 [Serratia sp. S1B]